MKRSFLRMATLALGLLVAGWLCGCQHRRSDYYMPQTHPNNLPPTAGSISDINRKLKRARGLATKEAPQTLLLLVAHDAAGKPVVVEIRRSSGDPALDSRAQAMVMKKWRFPSGRANTLLVPVEPGAVPRK